MEKYHHGDESKDLARPLMMCVAVSQDIAFGVCPSARVSFVLSRHALAKIGRQGWSPLGRSRVRLPFVDEVIKRGDAISWQCSATWRSKAISSHRRAVDDALVVQRR
jgi:hypothetical protein